MAADSFYDTNILLYGYDLNAKGKRKIALKLMEHAWLNLGSVAVSVQVLQEFYVNFVRKTRSHEDARIIVEDLSLWPVVDNSLDLFGLGVRLCEDYQLSLWDGMIVAAARKSGASALLTEDLNHGQDYGGVVAINPFITAENAGD